jgi:hypothetical protein
MSPKEQSELLVLLHDWKKHFGDPLPRDCRTREESELIERTEKFLKLEEPESHGRRRG